MTQWHRKIEGPISTVRNLAFSLRNGVRKELLGAAVPVTTRNLCERQSTAVANYVHRFLENADADHVFSGFVHGSVDAQGKQHIHIEITSQRDPYAETQQGAAA